jgi:hypothetical protein
LFLIRISLCFSAPSLVHNVVFYLAEDLVAEAVKFADCGRHPTLIHPEEWGECGQGTLRPQSSHRVPTPSPLPLRVTNAGTVEII